jgi:hypothetical protein
MLHVLRLLLHVCRLLQVACCMSADSQRHPLSPLELGHPPRLEAKQHSRDGRGPGVLLAASFRPFLTHPLTLPRSLTPAPPRPAPPRPDLAAFPNMSLNVFGAHCTFGRAGAGSSSWPTSAWRGAQWSPKRAHRARRRMRGPKRAQTRTNTHRFFQAPLRPFSHDGVVVTIWSLPLPLHPGLPSPSECCMTCVCHMGSCAAHSARWSLGAC